MEAQVAQVPTDPRRADAEVDRAFLTRWSPRAFTPDPVHPEALRSLLEAARWAPSCFNEQPWEFLVAVEEDDRRRFLELLSESNRHWAQHAPVLLFVVARRAFTKNGKPNRTAAFDCGAAWMSLALEAQRRGLSTHAMAGFDVEASYGALGLDPERHETICAVAVGYRSDDASKLSPAHQEKEKQRSTRRRQHESTHVGRFGAQPPQPSSPRQWPP